MAVYFKAAAAIVTAAILSVAIKKTNPEMSLCLGIGAACLTVCAVFTFASGFDTAVKEVRLLLGSSVVYVMPVFKCAGIAVLTRIVSDICRDAAQSTLATAAELTGTVCCIACAMPMISGFLKMICEMV